MSLGIALASLAFSPPGGSKLAQPPKGLAELALPVLAAGVLAVGAPVAAFAADAAAGQQIFDGNCAACHAGGQNVIVPEKTLEKDVRRATQFCARMHNRQRSPQRLSACRRRGPQALKEYLDGGFKPESVIKQVTNGKNAMPAFGGRLSDADIANVAAYVIQSSDAGWN